MDEQFQRIARFIGDENVEKLFSMHVAVAGVGAVGGYAIEMLARCGIGHITIADFDTVAESNINRQIIALHSTVGRMKTEVMAERILDINPHCIVNALPVKLTESNIDAFIRDKDIVLDCIDSVEEKTELLARCYENNTMVISSMGAALRKHTAAIQTGDIMETHGCPLAKAVRTRLRKRGIGKGIRCVFSPEPVDFKYTDPSEDPDAEKTESGRKRMVLGSLPFVTAVFGEKMAELALSSLLPGVLD